MENIKKQFGRVGTSHSLDGVQFPPELYAGLGLAQAHRNLRREHGDFPPACYLTIPAAANQLTRHCLWNAAKIASLNPLGFVHDHIALGLCYAFHHQYFNSREEPPPRTVLIVRLGASSFDSSVVRISSDSLDTLSSVGTADVGCHSWSDLVIEQAFEQLESRRKLDLDMKKQVRFVLRRTMESWLSSLPNQPTIPLKLKVAGQSFEGQLNQSVLERFGKTIRDLLCASAQQALKQAGVDWVHIDAVAIAGGGINAEFVTKRLQQMYGGPLDETLIASSSTAFGAAIFAHLKSNGFPYRPFEIVDRTAFDIGYGSGGKIYRLVPAGTILPYAERKKFPLQPGQKSIKMPLHQRTGIFDPASAVGQCECTDLPPGQVIEFELNLDENGFLHVDRISPTGTAIPVELRHALILSERQMLHWRDWVDQILVGTPRRLTVCWP